MDNMDNMSGHLTVTDDQYFLLYFIMGVYFGPDLKRPRRRKSIFQRRSEGFLSYLSHQLAGSEMKTVVLEGVYYYILRKADESIVLKLPQLHQFFNGNLPAPENNSTISYPQFDSLFPPKLHPKSQFKNKYDALGNIVFIHDPDISYIKPVDIARFRKLTGLKSFLLDRDDPLLQKFMNGEYLCYDTLEVVSAEGYLCRDAVQTQADLSCSTASIVPNGSCSASLPGSNHFDNASAQMCNTITASPKEFGTVNESVPSFDVCKAIVVSPTELSSVHELEPRTIFLPSCPSQEEWSNILAATKCGISLAGTAAGGQMGPTLGLIDIGESDDSYLFRVSLPGVKRDESEFSCEVENNGKVSIAGVTTVGERVVYRHSQAFEMQSQNLCPPGHFSISFNLPGPVDPHQFSGNFGTDGILEGMIMKLGLKRTVA